MRSHRTREFPHPPHHLSKNAILPESAQSTLVHGDSAPCIRRAGAYRQRETYGPWRSCRQMDQPILNGLRGRKAIQPHARPSPPPKLLHVSFSFFYVRDSCHVIPPLLIAADSPRHFQRPPGNRRFAGVAVNHIQQRLIQKGPPTLYATILIFVLAIRQSRRREWP